MPQTDSTTPASPIETIRAGLQVANSLTLGEPDQMRVDLAFDAASLIEAAGSATPTVTRDLTLLLTGGRMAILRAPIEISMEDYAFIHRQLEAMREALITVTLEGATDDP